MRPSQARKNILIISATAGTGHRRAAEALEHTAEGLGLPIETRHVDILDFTTPLFRRLYGDVYLTIINTSPELWGYLYRRSDLQGPRGAKPPLMKLFDRVNYRNYLSALRSLRPDALICTHFLPYIALTGSSGRFPVHMPVFSVPTDYDVHSLWVHPLVRRYYVATDEAAWSLRARGVDRGRVKTTGIPVGPEFRLGQGRAAARKKLTLVPRAFTLLVLSGGYGVGTVEEVIGTMCQHLAVFGDRRFQVLVVCGRNERLFKRLSGLRTPGNVTLRAYPFVDFIHTLMDASDVLITKPGGLTVSEALAKELPMILFDPFPGQEGRNADYLTEKGAALRAINLPNLTFRLDAVIRSRGLLKEMKENIRAIARPDAAQLILEDVSRILTHVSRA